MSAPSSFSPLHRTGSNAAAAAAAAASDDGYAELAPLLGNIHLDTLATLATLATAAAPAAPSEANKRKHRVEEDDIDQDDGDSDQNESGDDDRDTDQLEEGPAYKRPRYSDAVNPTKAKAKGKGKAKATPTGKRRRLDDGGASHGGAYRGGETAATAATAAATAATAAAATAAATAAAPPDTNLLPEPEAMPADYTFIWTISRGGLEDSLTSACDKVVVSSRTRPCRVDYHGTPEAAQRLPRQLARTPATTLNVSSSVLGDMSSLRTITNLSVGTPNKTRDLRWPSRLNSLSITCGNTAVLLAAVQALTLVPITDLTITFLAGRTRYTRYNEADIAAINDLLPQLRHLRTLVLYCHQPHIRYIPTIVVPNQVTSLQRWNVDVRIPNPALSGLQEFDDHGVLEEYATHPFGPQGLASQIIQLIRLTSLTIHGHCPWVRFLTNLENLTLDAPPRLILQLLSCLRSIQLTIHNMPTDANMLFCLANTLHPIQIRLPQYYSFTVDTQAVLRQLLEIISPDSVGEFMGYVARITNNGQVRLFEGTAVAIVRMANLPKLSLRSFAIRMLLGRLGRQIGWVMGSRMMARLPQHLKDEITMIYHRIVTSARVL